MSFLLGICLVAGFALQAYPMPLEGILWAGVGLSAAMIVRWHGSGATVVTVCAASTAVVLGSLALVAP